MTALSEYQRLESTGIWREAPEAQRREVIVAFGDATLVISDPRSARALAHWSLPALTRLNPGTEPALYAPSPDADEELEIEDPAMIGAVEKVREALVARRPHPGRLRLWVVAGLSTATVALALFWLPGALIAHTASVAQPAQRSEVGGMVLAELATLTGAPCESAPARRVLDALSARLVPESRIVLVPTALHGVLALPGQMLVLGMPLVQRQDGPEAAAGHLLAAADAAALNDPLLLALRWAGLRAAFRLLATGALPATALAGYGQGLLTEPAAAPDKAEMAARLLDAGVDPSAYLKSLDDGEPFAIAAPPPQALMSDDDWVTLQGACMR
ncbi:MAG: hypothetical protein Q8Q63_02300 [Phaeovulum sp.]|uniref:hypothetical protein n=1 Tax=Phaeovulum sp. TaxID=2934796 RepID=UPI002736D339|nr:hypothetical protein [Phaeovulum sp.]MDP3860397.1 hypothetical protein [Phaeovulum sp.]